MTEEFDRGVDQYRAEWATLAGRNPRDVYVPLALRSADAATDGSGVGQCEDN